MTDPNEQAAGSPKKPRAKSQRSPKRSRKRRPPPPPAWRRASLVGLEGTALGLAALVPVIVVLGRSAERFGGTGFWSSLLPFALTVLALTLINATLLWLWLWVRPHLLARWPRLPAVAALFIAIGAGVYAGRGEFGRELSALRTLVGGVQEAERTTISHQVFAAYRRSDLTEMRKMMGRIASFLPAIEEAAKTYRVDPEVLIGVAAAESSFVPRESRDGGHGLFQITAPPRTAAERARKDLGVTELDLLDARHNTYVAAATLKSYLHEMRDDLFLGLLAYNIGPRNGGLLSIMKQYGARDFATIQPYLQNLPRDYPIRVLSAALAWRLWQHEGGLPRYEEGDNAYRIQRLGIPGLVSSN